MDIDQAACAAIIYGHAKDPMETFANNLYETQKMSAASVCHTEEERSAVIESESVKYQLTLSGDSMILDETQSDDSLAVQLVDQGKPAPETKGPGGTRTEIDGSTGPSHSYSTGYTLNEYAWPATHFKEDTRQILSSTSSDIISGVIPEAKSEIADEVVKPTILELFK